MYREIAPPRDVADAVACVWTSVSRGGVIFPDGCVDVVWRGDRLVVAGPATVPSAASVPRGVPVFGVRFRLGAASAALGMPAEEFLDQTVFVADAWGSDVEERVALGGPAALLAEVRARVRPVDPLARAAALAMARPDARVGALADEIGVSERQLRRRFLDAVGYGPKTLARVLRFQRFLQLAAPGDPTGVDAPGDTAGLADRGDFAGLAGRGDPAARAALDDLAGPGDGLAALAFAAGYADQAHLTRECRRLSGRTPAELLAAGAPAAGERVRIVQAARAVSAYRAA